MIRHAQDAEAEPFPLVQREGTPQVDYGRLPRFQHGAAAVLGEGRVSVFLEDDRDRPGGCALDESGGAAEPDGVRLQRQQTHVPERHAGERRLEGAVLPAARLHRGKPQPDFTLPGGQVAGAGVAGGVGVHRGLLTRTVTRV